MRQPVRGAGLMLPRVQRIRRGDRVLCYHRPTGTRLPELPEDHPEFIAAWAQAEAKKRDFAPPAAAGTLTAVIRRLRASKRWSELGQSYRRAMLRHCDAITELYGTAPARGIRQKHIEADLAKLDPNAANQRLKAWRLILAQAKKDGDIESNVSILVSKIPTKTAGYATWTPEEVARFRAHWALGSVQRAAFELLVWTGARVSDAARMTPTDIGRDGVLSFRQVKTGGMAYVPWTCPLPVWAVSWEDERSTARAAIEATAGATLIQTVYGKARTVKGLSNLISDAAKAAGIQGRSSHGLRKYRLTAIAEAGGSAHAIMAWGGHASLSEAERYTRSASRKALIRGAEADSP